MKNNEPDNSLYDQVQELKIEVEELKHKRIYQEDIIPSGIKPRSIGQELILTSEVFTVSATLGDNDQGLLTITISQGDDAKVFGVADMSIYATSVATNNQIPGGSSIDESKWQVIGPWNDWGTTDNNNLKIKLYIRNISAGSTDIIIKSTVRYLVNLQNTSSDTA